MNGTRRLTAAVLTATTLVASYLATSVTAEARPIPLPQRFGRPTSPPAQLTVVTHTSSPWWVFVIVAVAASALTLAASMAAARFRHTHPRQWQA